MQKKTVEVTEQDTKFGFYVEFISEPNIIESTNKVFLISTFPLYTDFSSWRTPLSTHLNFKTKIFSQKLHEHVYYIILMLAVSRKIWADASKFSRSGNVCIVAKCPSSSCSNFTAWQILARLFSDWVFNV